MRIGTSTPAIHLGLIVVLLVTGSNRRRGHATELPPTVPGREWTTVAPAAVSLDPERLRAFGDYVGGRGVVVRHGQLAYTWGDFTRRGDVASAVKPLFTHFLMRAVREGKLASLDDPVVRWEPRLADLNPDLGFKDRGITWRHLATQTSMYGLREAPGVAFAYNDWQMALFIDLLFNRVYGLPWEEVDRQLLLPFLQGELGCQDSPTFLAHARGTQPGRLHISPRDFARLGLLYLNAGVWGGRRLVPENDIRRLLGSPLPASLARAGTQPATLLPGQRTLGSQRIPDNQTDHFGSYSFLWWVNGIEATGRRHWPDAPPGTFAALGHGGQRAMVVMPEHDLVISWNDSGIDSPARENEAFRLAVAALRSSVDPRATGAAIREPLPAGPTATPPRLRVIIETDAGGDPDDEQSLVRFLLYANEWDVEGILANRPRARDRENLNKARTGLEIVGRLIDAYAVCWTNLVRHDSRYPDPARLRQRAVAGYDDRDDAVNLLLQALDSPDPRPVWYSDWGSDHGSATNNLRRALDRVRRERSADDYARLKSRIRLVSGDAFGEHAHRVGPPFVLWADTWRPELEGRRWYHRFSAITARAGGFDIVRDIVEGHGPLGALYPTNTTHWGKEGDSLSFLYLVPNGLNAPEHPAWGGWGGRLALSPVPEGIRAGTGSRIYDARVADLWQGTRHRDHTLARWAEDLQNDFRARLEACQPGSKPANRPPDAHLRVDDAGPALEYPSDFHGGAQLHLVSGQTVALSAAASTDPDGDTLEISWIHYPEAGTWVGPMEAVSAGAVLRLTAPTVAAPETLHWIARVVDGGSPRLARYRRLVVLIRPQDRPTPTPLVDGPLKGAFQPPAALTGNVGSFRPLLVFDDGRPVGTDHAWAERRRELRDRWETLLGPWPTVPERPRMEVTAREKDEGVELRRVRMETGPGQSGDGWLLVPEGRGPFPAVFVPFYDPETSIGRGRPGRDFARQLARRGFVTLSLGSPGGDARQPDTAGVPCQPLAYLASVARHAARVLSQIPEVDARRLGIVGHSYGGKWALFGAAFCDAYACSAFSDPGIVWDESRPNVNYWDPWYLGREFDATGRPLPPRPVGLPSVERPRTGAYRALVEGGHDLHEVLALIAPRPFLLSGGSEDPPTRWVALEQIVAVNRLLGVTGRVAMTSREGHDPTEASNEALVRFFELQLGGGDREGVP